MSDQPENLDRVDAWGGGYFLVDPEGAIRVRPGADCGDGVRLEDIVQELGELGMTDPLLLRFPQILADRRRSLHDAFDAAIKEFDYPSSYQGVFPVKVNHNQVVINSLIQGGYQDRFGVEVGSKAELCLALTLDHHPDAFVVCNGFKDRDYLELAFHASSHGTRILIIIENPIEVADILRLRSRHDHSVLLGFRARLQTKGSGRWQESTGDRGKFGLSTMEMVEGMERLEAAGCLSSLVCLHFHIGSQVSHSLNMKESVREAARLYTALSEHAPELAYLDIGGGLGVDYDGSATATNWSINYSLDEYARDAVYFVKDICERADVSPPTILSESGRALTAHHTVCVVSSIRVMGEHVVRDYSRFETDQHHVHELRELLEETTIENCRETLHDSRIMFEELLEAFKLGVASLHDRAVGECLYRDIRVRVLRLDEDASQNDPDILKLEESLVPKHICNFSVFMSAPDSWAVQQPFPVTPLSQLNDPSRRPATIGDITCDSDGKLEHFIGDGESVRSVHLHTERDSGPYHIGIFLLGAYQDVLGDFHNLFGTVDEGIIQVNGTDSFAVIDSAEGSSVEHSLSQFGFQPDQMMRAFNRKVDRKRDVEDIQAFKGIFLRILHGSTYLKP